MPRRSSRIRRRISRVRFLPQGVDPEIDRPAGRVPASYECDVSFVGSWNARYRHEILERLARMERVQFRGSA
jgi:hypothetical protein